MAFRHLSLKQGKIFHGLGKKKKNLSEAAWGIFDPALLLGNQTILGILQLLIAYLNILQRKSRGV